MAKTTKTIADGVVTGAVGYRAWVDEGHAVVKPFRVLAVRGARVKIESPWVGDKWVDGAEVPVILHPTAEDAVAALVKQIQARVERHRAALAEEERDLAAARRLVK